MFVYNCFFFEKGKKPHKIFHILKMKTHFEKELHFENESSFRNPFWKWKHVFSLSCQCVKMNAPSERISAYCDLCHHVDDDPHHHWCRKLLRHTQSWWQVFSRDQTRVVWNCQTTSLESYHFTLLTDVNIIYCKVASSNKSRLEAHAGFFRLPMKGIFDPYVLWPFSKKLIS